MSFRQYIEVSFRYEGEHSWPEAPAEVAFLRVKHRHVFHSTVRVEVTHADRELEFILLKRQLEKLVTGWGYDLGRRSCEHMAIDMIKFVHKTHGFRAVTAKVFEDGENGAIVETN